MSFRPTSSRSITVGIKTFYRPDALRRCLDSLVGHDLAEVIVADDGHIDDRKQEIYEQFKSILPLRVIALEYDSGLSAGRNAIANSCSNPYLLLLDDDQAVPGNFPALLSVLDARPDIGGVSGYWNEHGRLKCSASDLFRFDNYIVKDIQERPTEHIYSNVRYYIFDQIPNSTLFRTECLKEFPWDEHYKIGREHVDFYLTHKSTSSWRFAVTPDVVIPHRPREDSAYVTNFRHNSERLAQSERHFCRKWEVRGVLEGRKHLTPGLRPEAVHHMLRLKVPLSVIAFLHNAFER